LDTLKGLEKDGVLETTKFTTAVMRARSEEELMKIVNDKPLAFLSAVQSWAEANGIKGKNTDELISMFLDRLRSDMGFDTSSAGVPDERRILLVGGNDRLNAEVSAIGQMIYERYGEATWNEYRAKIEGDWGADGQFSMETFTMLDDALSTAKANYKPEYDASGKLLAPPPDVRIAQLYIELGKESGSIDPDKSFSDMAAQVLFLARRDLVEGDASGAPKPVTTLAKAVQTWLQLEQVYAENQRNLSDGKISENEYFKTESLLSVQIKEARGAVTNAAEAAGLDSKQLLDNDTAAGFVLALIDPAAASQAEKLSKLRASREALAHQIQAMGVSLAYPHMQQRLATLENLNAEIGQVEADLKKKGIEVHANPKASGSIGAGIELARGNGLDKAYAGEAAEARQAAAATYEDLFAKIERLSAKRGELAAVNQEEAAGTLSPGLAETKKANLKAEIAGLEGELTQLAKANGVAPDTYTDPDKAKGYMAAARTSGLGELFATRRQLKEEIDYLENYVAGWEKSGLAPFNPDIDTKRAQIAEFKAKLQDTEQHIHEKIFGVDPAIQAKRLELDGAKIKWEELDFTSKGSDEANAARAEYERLDKEFKELEASPRPPVDWQINIDAYAEGALGAESSKANAGWRYQNDAAFKAGYDSLGNLTPEELAAIAQFVKDYDAAAADKMLDGAEQEALIAKYKEVAAFLPPQFHGPMDTSGLGPTDGAWIDIYGTARDLLDGSFAEGQAQRKAELQAQNEQLVLAADAPALLGKLTELADGKLKGESATAHVQYALQVLGIELTPEELAAFAKGEELPLAKQKSMQVAAQYFAQSLGLTVDDATALKTLRNALNGDMGNQKSDHKVGKWEEYTFAGTDDPNIGPATPQTELLRSQMSVLREIYAEVYGEEAAAALDKKVEPRFFDGAIVPVEKTVTGRGGERKVFEHYALDSGHWDAETGQVTGFKDKPSAMTEWTFEVVLEKNETTRGRGGALTQTKIERVNPNDQDRIAKLKEEGFTIDRVEANPASEPQRMLGRLIEGLFEYMKSYKPEYDENGTLKNPPPIARIAQYYVQTELKADATWEDNDEDNDHDRYPLTNFRIEQTGEEMSDQEAIRTMFTDLGAPPGEIDALLGIGGKQLNDSSRLYDPESKAEKIAFTVIDALFGFGLGTLFRGLDDMLNDRPLTDFANDKLDEQGRDRWRPGHRESLDDPNVMELVFEGLLLAVPDVSLGIVFNAAATSGRLARAGAEVADTAMDATKGGARTLWDVPDADNGTLRNLFDPTAAGPKDKGPSIYDEIFGGNPPSYTIPVYMADTGGSADIPLVPLRPASTGLATPPLPPIATRVPEIEEGGLTPSSTPFYTPPDTPFYTPPGTPLGGTGSPGVPTTTAIYRWEPGVTFETSPPFVAPLTGDGTSRTYVSLPGPDGKDVEVRVVQDADGQSYIYNPSEGASSVPNMPRVVQDPATRTWRMENTTPVFTADYDRLLANGDYLSNGRLYDAPGPLAGMATNELVELIRTGKPLRLPADPIIFESADPLTLLQPNGRKFLDEHSERKGEFLSEYNDLKDINAARLLELQKAREDEAFWTQAVDKLDRLRSENPGITWKVLREQDPEFADALAAKQRKGKDFDKPDDDTRMSVLLARGRAELEEAATRVPKAKKEVQDNAQEAINIIRQADDDGNALYGRSSLFTARNVAIGAAFAVVVGPSVFTFTQWVGPQINPPKKPAAAALPDVKETIPMAPNKTQTVDVAGLSGTKGKGYKYEIPADQVRDKGVKVDPVTGMVSISTRGDSVLRPGDTETFSVIVKDAKGEYKGKVSITVTVDGEKEKKPPELPLTTTKLEVSLQGPDAKTDLKAAAGIQNAAGYEFDPATPPPKGITIDKDTAALIAKPKDSDLAVRDYPLTVLVKGPGGENLGKVAVTVKVGA
jgi:hypothetical protein